MNLLELQILLYFRNTFLKYEIIFFKYCQNMMKLQIYKQMFIGAHELRDFKDLTFARRSPGFRGFIVENISNNFEIQESGKSIQRRSCQIGRKSNCVGCEITNSFSKSYCVSCEIVIPLTKSNWDCEKLRNRYCENLRKILIFSF